MLVVPSVMPKASRKPAPKLSFVLPSVQRMSAFGVSPRPCATGWLPGAAAVLFVKLPTLHVSAAAGVADAKASVTASSTSVRLIPSTVATVASKEVRRERLERVRHADGDVSRRAAHGADRHPHPVAGRDARIVDRAGL